VAFHVRAQTLAWRLAKKTAAATTIIGRLWKQRGKSEVPPSCCISLQPRAGVQGEAVSL